METSNVEIQEMRFGPEGGWTPLTDEERAAADQANKPQDFSILQTIIPRLWAPGPYLEPVLALEVISGQYKGLIFSFKNFDLAHERLQNGMIPVHFNVRVWREPVDFKQDEHFDNYTTEVLMAWMGYIATHELHSLMKVVNLGKGPQ